MARALTAAEIETGSRWATAELRSVTTRLAQDDLGGRNNDTPGSVRAQRYLISRLEKIGPGLDGSRTGDDAYRQPFVESGRRGTNLLAVIPGRDLPDEYVIVGAHYDHLGSSCDSRPGGKVCNGATDNATGVAVVLAVGSALRELPEPPRRSVVLALWDAEEDGLLGSLHYVDHPVVPLASTVAYVNFDILGADLLPSLRDLSFAIAAETGGAVLRDAVAAAIAAEDLDALQLSYVFGQLRSDYANFAARLVPTVFFSDATGACYHTTGDDVALIDWTKLSAQAKIAFRVVATLAESEARPPFVPPSPALGTYDDAVAIAQVIAVGLHDRFRFPAAVQVRLLRSDAELRAIVAAGPEAFDAQDVALVLDAALGAIDALTGLDCQSPGARRGRLPTLGRGRGG